MKQISGLICLASFCAGAVWVDYEMTSRFGGAFVLLAGASALAALSAALYMMQREFNERAKPHRIIKETLWSKLRELWAIRRRCQQIKLQQRLEDISIQAAVCAVSVGGTPGSAASSPAYRNTNSASVSPSFGFHIVPRSRRSGLHRYARVFQRQVRREWT